MSNFLGVKEGDIIIFENPDWAPNMFFLVNVVEYDAKDDVFYLETKSFLKEGNKIAKFYESSTFVLSADDREKYRPRIITDIAKVARLMLEGVV